MQFSLGVEVFGNLLSVRQQAQHLCHHAYRSVGEELFSPLEKRFELGLSLVLALERREQSLGGHEPRHVHESGYYVRVVVAIAQPYVRLVDAHNGYEVDYSAVEAVVLDFSK